MGAHDFEISFETPHAGWMQTYVRLVGWSLDACASYIDDPLLAAAKISQRLAETNYCSAAIILEEEGPLPVEIRFKSDAGSEICLVSVFDNESDFESGVVMIPRAEVAKILRRACKQVEPLLDEAGWNKEWSLNGFPTEFLR